MPGVPIQQHQAAPVNYGGYDSDTEGGARSGAAAAAGFEGAFGDKAVRSS